jgi:molybdenum cofactor cytidylyltransferase
MMGKLAAVVLAAGASNRFGADNKLLASIGGCPLVRRGVEAILASTEIEVWVVTGHDRPLIEKALSDLPVRFVHNENWPTGMGSSIAVGISALGEGVEGAFVLPADMPFISATLLRRLVTVFEQHDGHAIVFPALPTGEQRNPVLWPRRFFPKLRTLSGQEGAKQILQDLKSESVVVAVSDGAVLADIDTRGELEAVAGALAGRMQ